MARPRKNNADYFSHDCGMRNDRKIKALRKRYGLTGYAIWNMFLEVLADSNDFEIEIDEIEIELLAGDFDIDYKELKRIIDYLVKLGLIQNKNNNYWSEKLKIRLLPMIEKRERMRDKYNIAKVSDADTKVSAAETTQSKVKESKVKNNIYISHQKNQEFNEMFNDFKEMRRKIKKPLTTDRAEKGILNKLKDHHILIALKMLENSIINNWQGVFNLKPEEADEIYRLIEKEKPAETEHFTPEQIQANKLKLDQMKKQFGLKQ